MITNYHQGRPGPSYYGERPYCLQLFKARGYCCRFHSEQRRIGRSQPNSHCTRSQYSTIWRAIFIAYGLAKIQHCSIWPSGYL